MTLYECMYLIIVYNSIYTQVIHAVSNDYSYKRYKLFRKTAMFFLFCLLRLRSAVSLMLFLSL